MFDQRAEEKNIY